MGFVLALAKLLINPLNKSLFDVSIMNQLNTEVDIPPEEEEEEAKATHEHPSHTIDQTKIEVERTEAHMLHIEEENPFSKVHRYGTQKIRGNVEQSMQRTIDKPGREAKDDILFHKRARSRAD
jgi:hypothetical protein